MQRDRGTKGKAAEGGWMERLRVHATVVWIVALSTHNKKGGHRKRSRILHISVGLDRRRGVRKTGTGQNRYTVLAGYMKASLSFTINIMEMNFGKLPSGRPDRWLCSSWILLYTSNIYTCEQLFIPFWQRLCEHLLASSIQRLLSRFSSTIQYAFISPAYVSWLALSSLHTVKFHVSLIGKFSASFFFCAITELNSVNQWYYFKADAFLGGALKAPPNHTRSLAFVSLIRWAHCPLVQNLLNIYRHVIFSFH